MKKYYKYELNMMLANILSIVMMIVPILLLSFLGVNISWGESISLFLLLVILYFVLHELLHGLGFFFFAKDKKNIKFGITLENAVLFAAVQEKLGKVPILVSLLMPLVILSFVTFPIALLGNIPYLAILSIMNFAGAIGDILMFFLILRAPKDVLYIDYNTDIGCYLVSETDMSNYKSLGFKLVQEGNEAEKSVDTSIKRLYVSPSSAIILGVLLIISLLLEVL